MPPGCNQTNRTAKQFRMTKISGNQNASSTVEASIVGAMMELNGEVPANLSRLLRCAPESFDDQRCGFTAVAIRGLRATGASVNRQTVAPKLSFNGAAVFLAAECNPLPVDLAEIEAEKLWGKFQARQTAKLLTEGGRAAMDHPEQAADIRAHVRAALDNLDGDPLESRLAERLFNATRPPPEPATVFWIGTTGVCTAGNITTISAKSKHGKSAGIGAMVAATFAKEDCDCLGFKAGNPKGLAVVHIDTEQAPFDHHQLIARAVRRANAQAAPEWLRSYCLTGWTAKDIRASFRPLLQSSAKNFGGVLTLIVDGIADGAVDVNDPAESGAIVAELHALAIEFHCSVVAVIHLNPNSDSKTRGHLGSQLERKAETNLRLEKDANETVTIFADKNRRAPIPKATGPRFAWSDEAGMHVSVASQRSIKQDAEKGTMRIEADAVYTAAGESRLRYGQIIEFLMKEVHVSESTAKRHLDQMIKTGVVRKEITGLYALRS